MLLLMLTVSLAVSQTQRRVRRMKEGRTRKRQRRQNERGKSHCQVRTYNVNYIKCEVLMLNIFSRDACFRWHSDSCLGDGYIPPRQQNVPGAHRDTATARTWRTIGTRRAHSARRLRHTGFFPDISYPRPPCSQPPHYILRITVRGGNNTQVAWT